MIKKYSFILTFILCFTIPNFSQADCTSRYQEFSTYLDDYNLPCQAAVGTSSFLCSLFLTKSLYHAFGSLVGSCTFVQGCKMIFQENASEMIAILEESAVWNENSTNLNENSKLNKLKEKLDFEMSIEQISSFINERNETNWFCPTDSSPKTVEQLLQELSNVYNREFSKKNM